MSLVINKNSTIYVLCPAYIKTGGPELLHQLVCELNKNGLNAYITYFGINKKNKHYTPDDFKKYINEHKTLIDIDDTKDNILITPEVTSAINISKKIKNIQKVIWWLSVDNFESGCGLKNTLRNYGIITTSILILKRELIHNFLDIGYFNQHFCQSYYSIDYLKNKGIQNISYLSDYISQEYLNIENPNEKENIIAYNPKKGYNFTKEIIKNSPNLKFVPIENLTTIQVKELLLKSKVYIDFGNHPGKDRIPREAAMCGCCIITDKKGSAKFYEDLPINDEFKFEDIEENINNIIEKISECIENYDEEIIKFKEYKEFIMNEKSKFESDVKKIFLY